MPTYNVQQLFWMVGGVKQLLSMSKGYYLILLAVNNKQRTIYRLQIFPSVVAVARHQTGRIDRIDAGGKIAHRGEG